MKLAMAIERLNPGGSAAERSAWEIVAELARRGHEVTVFSSFGNGQAPYNVELLTRHDRPEYSAAGLNRYVRWLGEHLNQRSFDATLSVSLNVPARVVIPLSGVARQARACHVASHSSAAAGLLCRLGLAATPRLRLMCKLEEATAADPQVQFAVVNRAVADQLQQHHNVSDDRIRIIEPGTSLSPPTADEQANWRRRIHEQFAVSDAAVVFLMPVRELSPTVGPVVLRALCSIVDRGVDAALLMAGEFSHRDHQLACDLGVRDRVKFLGATDHLHALYAAADVTVNPSVYDPIGRTAMESMICGRPVITTRHNALHRAIAPNGLQPRGRVIGDAADLPALIEVMTALADDHERARCVLATRGLEQQWSIERHVDQLQQLLADAAA